MISNGILSRDIRLLPGDFARRETLCDWLSDQLGARHMRVRTYTKIKHSRNVICVLFHSTDLRTDIDNIVDDAFLERILWTDGCIFHSDGRINRHNEHHYAEKKSHCQKEIHVQRRFHINVWMGILMIKLSDLISFLTTSILTE